MYTYIYVHILNLYVCMNIYIYIECVYIYSLATALAIYAMDIYISKSPPELDKVRLEKRPIRMEKEAYISGKRDPFIWQKRPIYMSTPELDKVRLGVLV